jgi:hypothetical protein
MLLVYNPSDRSRTQRQPDCVSPLILDPERKIVLEPGAFGSAGVTELDPKIFKTVVLDRPGVCATVQEYVDRGYLQLQTSAGIQYGGDIKKWAIAKENVAFGELPTVAAKAAVENNMDIKQLKSWQSLDLDKAVQNAIADRIKILETPLNPDNQ